MNKEYYGLIIAMLICIIIVIITFMCTLIFDGTKKTKVDNKPDIGKRAKKAKKHKNH
jgi:uncharacterized membrane protein